MLWMMCNEFMGCSWFCCVTSMATEDISMTQSTHRHESQLWTSQACCRPPELWRCTSGATQTQFFRGCGCVLHTLVRPSLVECAFRQHGCTHIEQKGAANVSTYVGAPWEWPWITKTEVTKRKKKNRLNMFIHSQTQWRITSWQSFFLSPDLFQESGFLALLTSLVSRIVWNLSSILSLNPCWRIRHSQQPSLHLMSPQPVVILWIRIQPSLEVMCWFCTGLISDGTTQPLPTDRCNFPLSARWPLFSIIELKKTIIGSPLQWIWFIQEFWNVWPLRGWLADSYCGCPRHAVFLLWQPTALTMPWAWGH